MTRPERTEGMLPLSWSRVSKFQLCEISFEKSYIQEQPETRSMSSFRGSLVDELIQLSLNPDFDNSDLEAVGMTKAAELWSQGVEQDGVVYTTFDPRWPKFIGEVDLAVSLTLGYYNKVGEKLALDWSSPEDEERRPMQRTFRVVIEAPDVPVPIEVLAVPDITETNLRMRDVKVRDRDKSKEHHYSEQLSIDAWAAWKTTGQEDFEVVIDRLNPADPKNPTPKKSRRGRKDHEITERRLIRFAQTIWAKMQNGLWDPPPADTWKCSAQYCTFHPTCEWRRDW